MVMIYLLDNYHQCSDNSRMILVELQWVSITCHVMSHYSAKEELSLALNLHQQSLPLSLSLPLTLPLSFYLSHSLSLSLSLKLSLSVFLRYPEVVRKLLVVDPGGMFPIQCKEGAFMAIIFKWGVPMYYFRSLGR
jgi:hypothetical protein